MISDVAMASKVTLWLLDEGVWHSVRSLEAHELGIAVAIDPDGPLVDLLDHPVHSELGRELDEFLEGYGWTWEADEYDASIILRPLDEEDL